MKKFIVSFIFTTSILSASDAKPQNSPEEVQKKAESKKTYSFVNKPKELQVNFIHPYGKNKVQKIKEVVPKLPLLIPYPEPKVSYEVTF